MENFRILNKTNSNTKLKQQGGFQYKGNYNTEVGKDYQNRERSEISTDQRDKFVELKGISDDIIEERRKAALCLK